MTGSRRSFIDVDIAAGHAFRVDWTLVAACAALGLGAVSLWRCYVPPQSRKVLELTGRVEDLEFGYDETRKRLTMRAARENMATARTASDERRARRDKIEEQAEAILAGKNAPAAAPADDPDSIRARLRAQHLSGPLTKQ